MRVAFAVVLVACVAGLSTASAQPAPRIVFAADRTTTRTGEIYSFDLATGVTRDISRSLASDSAPAVSPDGKRIAFESMRDGALGLYLARLDGSGVSLVKRFHSGLSAVSVQWSPDGSRIAAIGGSCCSAEDALWIGTPAGVGVTRWNAAAGAGPGVWSPDGRLYAYAANDLLATQVSAVDVVDAQGRLAWSRNVSRIADLGWSSDGRLAWLSGDSVQVAAETGSRLPGFPAQSIAWSPDGRTLAALRTHSIELRRDGDGPVHTVYRPSVGHTLIQGIRWLGPQHLVFSARNVDTYLRLDLRTGKTTPVGYEDAEGVISPDQRLLASEYWGRSSYRNRQLRVGPLVGGGSRVIAATKDCPDDHGDPFQPAEFVPGRRMLVYVTECGDPTADLYSVDEDGGGLRQLTYTAAHEQSPVLSPDGSRVAYVRSESIGHSCAGCPSGLWVMNADGSHARRLTYPVVKDGTGEWDADPSWSPDGKWIVFDRSTIDSVWHLMVISADGGTPRVLPIPGARHGVWGPARIAYTDKLGALWTAMPDGSDPRLVASRHTCDGGCSYTWTTRGLIYATVARHVAHTTILIRGAGPERRVQLPFAPEHVGWIDDGTTLLVSPPAQQVAGQWDEGDLYRVAPDGTLTRLTTGLGAISIAG